MPSKRVLAILLLGAIRLQAAEFHVAATGSDTADGTASAPVRTIQKGIDLVTRSGGTLVVSPGIYREELTLRSHSALDRPIVIRAAERQSGSRRLPWRGRLATRTPRPGDLRSRRWHGRETVPQRGRGASAKAGER